MDLVVRQECDEFEFITEFGFITLGLTELDSCISDVTEGLLSKESYKTMKEAGKGQRAQKSLLTITPQDSSLVPNPHHSAQAATLLQSCVKYLEMGHLQGEGNKMHLNKTASINHRKPYRRGYYKA